MKRKVESERAPKAIGPYSPALKYCNFIFVSGQLGMDAQGNLKKDIKEQTEQALENVKALLESAGASLDDVVKVTIYTTDMSKFSEINEVYSKYFKEPYPARAVIGVAKLPKDADVEIEAIAIV